MQENKMGVMKVDKLLITMSLPMMVSMLVQALYNIVDSIFVSRISENALTAVSLAFPIQTLMVAFSTGVGVGMNALLSRSLGEKNFKKVNESATNGVFMQTMVYILFLLVGLFAVKPFYASQTRGADPEIYHYGVTYLRLVCVCSFGMYMQMIFERMLMSTGKTVYSMICQTVGAVINLIFDPILIFGYFGFPKLGVAGAAIATVGGQITASILAITFNLKVNKEVHLSFKGFRPNGATLLQILSVGIPTTIMQAIGSVMSYLMNRILIGFTSTATAVFGVYFKLQSFVFMPIFGMNNGVVPIVAYNLGAKKPRRIKETIKLALVFAEIVMFIGTALFELAPAMLLSFFDASDRMLEIGVPALRIMGMAFPFVGVGIISSSTFQALGKGVYSMTISLLRQLIVLIPVASFLARFGLRYVWWSFPIAELISFAASVIMLVLTIRNVVNKIPDSEAA